MGFFKTYENNVIEVWECDTCTHHGILVDKINNKEVWFSDKNGIYERPMD